MGEKKRSWISRAGKGKGLSLLALFSTGFAVAAACLALYVFQPAILRTVDYKIYDSLLIRSDHGKPSPVPAVVDIDEASLKEVGQWPWPRYQLAQLIARLYEGGAASVGLDMLLSEQDRSSPLRLRENLQRDFGLELPLDAVPEQLRDNDALLADVLRASPTVTGFFLQSEAPAAPAAAEGGPGAKPAEGEKGAPGPAFPPACGAVNVSPKDCPSPRAELFRYPSAILPLPEFRSSASGFINVIPDRDGIIRSVPLIAEYGGRLYANLSLRTLMAGLGVKNLVLRSGPDGLEEIRLGRWSVPIMPNGTMRVPFRGGRGVYPVFSACDVLAGRVPAGELEGRVLFIGASAAGLMDLRATPFTGVFPGVETHTAVVDSILSQRFIKIPAWTPGAQVLGIMLCGFIAALVCAFTSPAAYVPVGGALMGGTLWGSWHLFQQGIFLSPLYVLLSVGSQMLVVLALRFWTSERQKRRLRSAFGQYVSPEIVKRIDERGGELLAGEQRELTIFFADIRGFTTLSEKLSPGQVVAMLNRYFTPMTACVRENGGTLDKFIGDAIMAFWNAPLDVPDHPRRAVLAVLEMQEHLVRLNAALEPEFGITLRNGSGLHTGLAYVGNMGSDELMDYTCIGDNVNLASRLEGLTGQYGVPILMSGETAARCGDIPKFLLDSIRVKGRSTPVDIYTAMTQAEAEARAEEFRLFAEARGLYAEGRFAEAAERFEALAAGHPAAAKMHALFARRCRDMQAAPPADWDGVWTFYSK